MKRLAFSLLVALCLCACSKDSGLETSPKAGQYIYADGTITAAVNVGKYNTVGITIFENGSYVYQDLNGSVQDAQPGYRYSFSGAGFIHNSGKLVIMCEYSNSKEFTAVVETNETAVTLPASMPFRYDNTVLDINGDGVLDSTQQLSKLSAN